MLRDYLEVMEFHIVLKLIDLIICISKNVLYSKYLDNKRAKK